MTADLACPRCGQALRLAAAGLAQPQPCPGCQRELQLWSGPLLGRPAGPRVGARALAGDAVCFFHAGRRAESACDACSRYVCALCDLPMGGAHLCPACVEEGRSPQAQALVLQHRVRYERLVFVGALVSVVPPILFLSFLTAPVVIYFAIRGWAESGQLLPFLRRSARWRLALGLLIAVLQLGAWAWIGGKLALKALA